MRKQPTLLVGGYIKTDLLDVNFIKALAIDAYTINTNTLFAKNIATASSAKRVEITSDLNNIRIFDASGNV